MEKKNLFSRFVAMVIIGSLSLDPTMATACQQYRVCDIAPPSTALLMRSPFTREAIVSRLLANGFSFSPRLTAWLDRHKGARSFEPAFAFAVDSSASPFTEDFRSEKVLPPSMGGNSARSFPGSPEEVQDVKILSKRDHLIFAAFSLSLLLGSIGYTAYAVFSQEWNWGTIARAVFVAYIVLMGGVRAAGNWWLSAQILEKPLFMSAPPEETFRVAMVTMFVPGKEPIEILERTLTGMAEVTYAHDTFVLDEGDSPEVKALVQQLDDRFRPFGRRVFHYSRSDKSQKEKGANITAWLNNVGYAHYDVATFMDCDHKPLPQYLDRVLGFMGKTRKGKKVVFVQTPAPYGNRMNRGGNLIAEGAEQMRQPTFGIGLPGYYGQDTPLIIGDHTTIDLHALKEISGYQVHQSDDLLTAKKLVALGYTGIYTPDEVVAYGIGPQTWKEHFVQQRKWAYGVVDLQFRHFTEPVRGLGIRQHIMWIVNGLGYFFMTEAMIQSLFILSLLVIAPFNMHLDFRMVIFALPLMALRWGMAVWVQKFYPEFSREGRTYFRLPLRLVSFASWPYAFQGIILALRRKVLPREVTPKDADLRFQWRLFRWHAAMVAAVAVGETIAFFRNDGGLLYLQLYGAVLIALNLFPILHALWVSRTDSSPPTSEEAPSRIWHFGFWSILLTGLAVRVAQLNTNGPFSDESHGQMVYEYGRNLFAVLGDPWIFPLWAGWMHTHLGLIGARFASSLFSLATTVFIYPIAKRFAVALKFPQSASRLIGLGAMAVFTLSEPALATSQQASYHALAFVFFTLGFWLLVRGVDKQKHSLLVGSALAFSIAFETRYMLFGYLPVAVLYAVYTVFTGDGQFSWQERWKTAARAFLLPLFTLLGVYVAVEHTHIAAALSVAGNAGASKFVHLSMGAVLKMAFSKAVPAALLGSYGTYRLYHRLKQRSESRTTPYWHVAFLIFGSGFIVMYHLYAGHFLQMDQNFVLGMIFASVLAGIGVYEIAAALPAWRKSSRTAVLALALFLALLWGQARTALVPFQSWPDWRPVVAAAQQLPAQGLIWSTADSAAVGNVWALREAMGSRVDVQSPWYAPDADSLLRLAAEERIPYVVGHYFSAPLTMGMTRYGFVVARVIPVKNGPIVYLFENKTPSLAPKPYDNLWTDNHRFVVGKQGPLDASKTKALRVYFPSDEKDIQVRFQLLPQDENPSSPRGTLKHTFQIPENGLLELTISDFELSKKELTALDDFRVESGETQELHQAATCRARFYRLEMVPQDGSSPVVLVDRSVEIAPFPVPIGPAVLDVVPANDASVAIGMLDQRVPGAWVHLGAHEWTQALADINRLEKDCPSCWVEARRVNQELQASSDPWSSISKEKTVSVLYARYGILYQAAAAEYIRLTAALAIHDTVSARRSLRTLLVDFSYGQVYDLHGFMWSPILSAVRECPALLKEVISHDIPRGHPLAKGYGELAVEAQLRLVLGWIQERWLWLGSVVSGALVLSRRLRQSVQKAVSQPGALTGSALVLTVFWVGPTLLQLAEHVLLGQSFLSVVGQVFMVGIGMLYIMNLALTPLSALWALLQTTKPDPPALHLNDPELPKVTVQIPTRHEPAAVTRRAIESALALHYPRERLEIQVIDNSDRKEAYQEIEVYAAQAGIIFIHRDGTEGYKARNLNIGMTQSTGEFFLVLDADSTVEPDALLKGLAHFREDSKLGFTQFRMTTGNESLNLYAYQRIQHALSVQGFARFDGHNGLIRRQAMEDIGGWPELVSEDLAASIQMRLKGYHGRFIDSITSSEDAPETYKEFLGQRRKWAFGTMRVIGLYGGQILRSPELRLAEKISILQQMGDYVLTALAFALSFTYFHFSPVGTAIVLLIPQVPLWLASWRRPLTPIRIFLPALALMASSLPTIFLGVFAAAGGRTEGFRVTLKQGGSDRLPWRDLIRLHAFTFAAVVFFFAYLPFNVPDPIAYLTSGQPTVLTMISSVMVPIVTNYMASTGRGGGRHGGKRQWVAMIAA
jgi:cellulose synthase (UDP-forming)